MRDHIIAHFYTPNFKGHYYEPVDNIELYWKPYNFGGDFYVRCIKDECK